MKTADLQAGGKYATCNGELVVPVEPVHAKYQFVKDPNKDEDEWTILDLNEDAATPDNPWGKCVKEKPRAMHRWGRPGVKVFTYEVDRDGEPIHDTRREAVVRPQDIAGTWKAYLTLYGHIVRAEADRKYGERRVGDTLFEIRDHVSSRGWTVKADHHKGFRGQTPRYKLTIEVTAASDDDDEYHDSAVRMAKAISRAAYDEYDSIVHERIHGAGERE